MEQGLYEQVVKLRWKDLIFIAANKNKNEAKFKFQGQSEDHSVGLILTLIVSK